MPCAEAEEYAGIYGSQAVLDSAEKQATRDAMITLVPFVNLSHDHPEPSPQQAAEIKHNMEIQQAQLLLVDAALQGLKKTYQVFLTSHKKLTTSSLWSP